MMLTILIILCLGTSFYAGYRRGLMLQLVYGLGYVASFVVAQSQYKALGKKLELLVPYPAPTEKTSLVLFDKNLIFDLDKAFYAGFAFILIVFIGWLLTRFVGMLCYGLTFRPVIQKGNDLAGGVLNALLTVVGLTLCLTLLAMVPLDFIQNLFKKSSLARFLVDSTPIISNLLHNWWITKIIL
ncbi:CvpA family protein [Vagococcus sp. DIV0080]|uniref:CvpA family protein n=1 Tax=Candidatus Vagococcus giribetii TaxID=2230876 RepID=A0ABS3HSD8_9ENTE|nr:CvpA family protein [Vagococcus sp. DIV0080]MBO0476629.1 CvpA family protein [Vagococcus sp. DIV0080]